MSVRLSITLRYYIEMAKQTIRLFTQSVCHTILVFPYETLWQYFDGDHPNGSTERKGYEKIAIFGQ